MPSMSEHVDVCLCHALKGAQCSSGRTPDHIANAPKTSAKLSKQTAVKSHIFVLSTSNWFLRTQFQTFEGFKTTFVQKESSYRVKFRTFFSKVRNKYHTEICDLTEEKKKGGGGGRGRDISSRASVYYI